MGYDPEAPADDNAKEMAAAVGNVVAGEVTQAVRDSTSDVGPIARGRLPRHRPRRHPGRRADRWPTPPPRLLDLLVSDDHEIVTVIEGEGATAADTRAHHRVAGRAPARSLGRGAPRRPAAVPLPVRRRVAGDRHDDRRAVTLGELAASPVTVPERGRRREGRGRWRAVRHHDRARPAHPLPAPLHRPHQPGARSATWVGEEAMVLGHGRARVVAPHAGPPAQGAGHGRRAPTAPATCGVTFFNQPWRERQLPAGHRGGVLRQARPVPAAEADDQPGGRPDRQPHRARSCRSTRSPTRPACPPGTSPAGSPRRSAGRRASPTRCPTGCSTASTSSTGPRRSAASTPPESMAHKEGPPPAGARRAAAGPARPGPAQAAHRADHPGHRPRHRGAAGRRGSSTACRSTLTADQRAAVDEIAADLAGPAPDAPAAAGRRRQRQDRGRRGERCSPPCRAATRARSWRPPRCWPSSTPPGIRALLDGVDGPDDGATAVRRAAAAGRAADQPGRRRRAAPDPRRAGRGRGRPRHRHPRPDPGGRRVRSLGVGGDRRAAPLRRRAAGRAARQGAAAAPCPTCWS